MPLVRVALPRGTSAAHRQAISDGIHQSLVEVFKVPADDRFQIIGEHEAGTEIVRPKSYLGVEYSDKLIIVQITANDTRTTEQKVALYKDIAARLTQATGMRAEDIVISLVEVKKENWSFGNGVAQYV
jgi:phenylpyruvate tautomerase PptA (4-oxalocrotonate tautomerase family)